MKTDLPIVTDHHAASAQKDIAGIADKVSPDAALIEMAGLPCTGI